MPTVDPRRYGARDWFRKSLSERQFTDRIPYAAYHHDVPWGQGAQYYQMGRELYRENPVFRQAMDRCDVTARGFKVAGIVDEMAPDVTAWRRGDRVMW